jgi:hypothetical protein
MDREIRILLDERALGALLNRYCHTMDSGDNAGWLDCFTGDALYEVALPDGTVFARLEGAGDLKKFIAAYPVRQGHKHVYVTPVFSVDPDGGTATIDSYFFMMAGDATHSGISSLGRCRDECIRTDAGWRFKARRVATEAMTPP